MSALVHCDVQGESSPAFVFLHGYTLDHTMWRQQVAMFQHDYMSIAVDIPGFGQSSLYSGHDIHEVAIRIRHTIKTYTQSKPYILCGLSMGGYLALEIAKCFPDDIERLIISNTESRSDSEDEKKKRDIFIQDILEKGSQNFLQSVAPLLTSQVTQAEQPHITTSLLEKMQTNSDDSLIFGLRMMRNRPDYREFSQKFTRPTLVIGGSDDQLCSFSDIQDTVKNFAKGSLRIIDNTGHLTPMESPIEFNQAVHEFLQSDLSVPTT